MSVLFLFILLLAFYRVIGYANLHLYLLNTKKSLSFLLKNTNILFLL